MSESGNLTHRVLIVDDDDDVRSGLGRALDLQPNLEVETAEDSFEAGYKLASFRPEVVILDVVMPGMGGHHICERIRALAAADSIRIMILTGYPGGGSSERSLLSGADLFLTKPQDVQTLRMHIEDLLGL
jgi:DNA-binding response OmpR family regulator